MYVITTRYGDYIHYATYSDCRIEGNFCGVKSYFRGQADLHEILT